MARISYHLPEHVCPFPVNPALHLQEKLLIVLVHIAFASQLCVPKVHSSTSVHGERMRIILITSLKLFVTDTR